MCIYIYIYRERERDAYVSIYVCMYTCIYIYIYIDIYICIHNLLKGAKFPRTKGCPHVSRPSDPYIDWCSNGRAPISPLHKVCCCIGACIGVCIGVCIGGVHRGYASRCASEVCAGDVRMKVCIAP